MRIPLSMKVTEIFASIQGEGLYVGLPQTFVRLSGCNMRCFWCDTQYALEGGCEMSFEQILERVSSFGIASVCITGGEPLIQLKDCVGLMNILKSKEYALHLQTNGSIYDETAFSLADCVCLDIKPPSSGEKSDQSILKKLRDGDYVTVVIDCRKDYEFARKIAKKADVPVFFQPTTLNMAEEVSAWAVSDRVCARIVPQMHKLIGLK